MTDEDYGYDLGTYSLPVRAATPEAQRWFDRGLNWTYGFNHEEAVVCFKKAIAHYEASEYQEARDLLEKVLEVNPGDNPARYYLSIIKDEIQPHLNEDTHAVLDD